MQSTQQKIRHIIDWYRFLKLHEPSRTMKKSIQNRFYISLIAMCFVMWNFVELHPFTQYLKCNRFVVGRFCCCEHFACHFQQCSICEYWFIRTNQNTSDDSRFNVRWLDWQRNSLIFIIIIIFERFFSIEWIPCHWI